SLTSDVQEQGSFPRGTRSDRFIARNVLNRTPSSSRPLKFRSGDACIAANSPSGYARFTASCGATPPKRGTVMLSQILVIATFERGTRRAPKPPPPNPYVASPAVTVTTTAFVELYAPKAAISASSGCGATTTTLSEAVRCSENPNSLACCSCNLRWRQRSC